MDATNEMPEMTPVGTITSVECNAGKHYDYVAGFRRLPSSDGRREVLFRMHACTPLTALLLLLSVARVIMHQRARYAGDRCTMAK